MKRFPSLLLGLLLALGTFTFAQSSASHPGFVGFTSGPEVARFDPPATHEALIKAVFTDFHPMFFAGHSTTLSWAQAGCTNCTVTGNKVYVSATTGGPYSVLFTSPTPITTYTDSAVTAGQVKFYVVSAICSACTTVESPFSNEVKATTPPDTQPAAPASLTVTVQ